MQGACGARSKIEVKSDGDISLEYCDDNDEDDGCIVTREVRKGSVMVSRE